MVAVKPVMYLKERGLDLPRILAKNVVKYMERIQFLRNVKLKFIEIISF